MIEIQTEREELVLKGTLSRWVDEVSGRHQRTTIIISNLLVILVSPKNVSKQEEVSLDWLNSNQNFLLSLYVVYLIH